MTFYLQILFVGFEEHHIETIGTVETVESVETHQEQGKCFYIFVLTSIPITFICTKQTCV